MRLCSLLILAACSTSATPPANTKTMSDGVTLAVVMSGWEMWIGNDKDPRVAHDAPERTPGALDRVTAAFAKAAPASANALLVTYANKAQLRVPLGQPLTFGTQQDYHSEIGIDLVKGLVLAADQLEAAPPGHRYLIVLGDGTDTNPEAALVELPKLADRFAKAHVEVTAIVYRTQISADRDFIDKLTKHVIRTPTLDEFQTALTSTLATVR